MFARIVRGSFLREPRRAANAAAAVFVPAALLTAVANFLLDARQKMSRELRSRGPNLVLVGVEPKKVPLDRLRESSPRAIAASPLARGLWTVDGTEIPLLGFDPPEGRRLRPGWRVEGTWLTTETMLGARLAERLGLGPGDEFGGRRIEGVVETGEAEDEAAFLPFRDALAKGADLVAIEWILPGTAGEVEAEGKRLAAAWGAEARVQHQIAAGEGALLGRLTRAFALVGALVLLVCGLSMATTLVAGVSERRRDYGVLRSLGAEDDRIVRLFAAEVGALFVAGLLPGLAAGLLLSGALARAVFASGSGVRPLAVGAAALACAAMAAAAALAPLRRALAVDPARVLKEE